MQTNPKTLQQIALLSRLELDNTQEVRMLRDLNQILDWVDILQEIDTSAVEPLIHLSEELNVMRQDIILAHLKAEEALQNAPQKDEVYFKVPKVLG